MTTKFIRQKLYEYIRNAEDKKIKAIYTMVEDEIEKPGNYWEDEAFTKELRQRSEDYKTGKVKPVKWEDAKKRIQASSQKKITK